MTGIWIGSEFSPLELRISTTTGLPTGLRSPAHEQVIDIDARAAMTLGGLERRGPLGGLVYDGAREVDAIRATGPAGSRLLRDGRIHSIPVALGGWSGSARYTFRSAAPSLTWSWHWRPTGGPEHLRDFTVAVLLRLPDPAGWLVNAPGGTLRGDLPLPDLPPSTVISTVGGLAGSTGVVVASRATAPVTVVLWPRSLDEIGHSLLAAEGAGLRLVYATGLAAAAVPETVLDQDGIALDLLGEGWPAVRDRLPGWLEALGIRTPPDSPTWTHRATIYETQLGTSIFAGGSWTYSPYPTAADLRRDLPRIARLGFDTIQLMPRQPFPSYNVVDYDDIALSYGEEGQLREIVEWCHGNGMRVVLDVLLHGVIDGESITEAADAVRAGPWASLAGADPDPAGWHTLSAAEQVDLSWSRHVLDFEKVWREGAPERHPLCEEHPEWFCTDSHGRIIGIYTKAFDMSNPAWQDYFTAAMIALVERLGIDGFRFDAPTYNLFPNWSPRTRTRASLQPLGSVRLFRRLRDRLHRLNPGLMMYTEPNGPLLRQSMDLNYNYDETWLPASILRPGDPRFAGGVRSGRELAAWLRDRDASLPAGSVTAHHIDSHDTFWWPPPGGKWRREQFGLRAARALMHAFALAGGPYMMFVGGEVGMEEAVMAVNAIRAGRPELAYGSHRFGAPATDRDELFTVTHRAGKAWSAVLVNLSPRAFTAQIDLPAGGMRDLLNPEARQPLHFEPFQARMLAGGESS
jgi:alpha amylase-like protein